MKSRSLLAAIAAVAALLATPAQAYLFSAVYSFGDSLSDTGNSGLMTDRPLLPPDPPYADGRFSNGPVAAERLAQGRGVQLYSYAVGGAMSGTGNADVGALDAGYSSGVLKQLEKYLTDSGGTADANALYMVLGGSNDFLHLLDVNPGAGQAEFDAVATEVITNLTTAVYTLYQAGATKFLLPLLPDIGAAPIVQSAEVTLASASVNFFLKTAYLDLLASLADPGVTFTIFDTFEAQQGLLGSFSNVTDACLSAGLACAPDQYFFLDDLHPTARVHALLGDQLLAAVPEPGGLLLAAIGLAALAGRRRPTPMQRAVAA